MTPARTKAPATLRRPLGAAGGLLPAADLLYVAIDPRIRLA